MRVTDGVLVVFRGAADEGVGDAQLAEGIGYGAGSTAGAKDE